MPRLRTVVLAFVATTVTGGLAAGFAWRWLVRDALARRAGIRLGLRALVQPRGGARELVTGLKLLPLTWGGVVATIPLWPSAFPGLAEHVWIGWAPVVALPLLFVAGLVALLARAYRATPGMMQGDATTDLPARALLRRPFAIHLGVAAAFALPATIAGALLLFTWPGLTSIRVALAVAALAPAAGALAAIPSLLAASNARLVPFRPIAPRALPRWALPAGLLTLAFAWGVVAARVVGILGASSPLLPDELGEWAETTTLVAEARDRTLGAVMTTTNLAEAGMSCETEVVYYADVPGGALAWCEEWDAASGYRTQFVLTRARTFGGETFPRVLARTWVSAVDRVVPIEGGVAVLTRHDPNAKTVAPKVVALVPRWGGIVRKASWNVPAGPVSGAAAVGDGLLLRWPGARGKGDRFVLLDGRLRPRYAYGLDRLRAQLGAYCIALLGIAAAVTLLAVVLVVRAGRLGRILRRRAARASVLAGPGLWRGRLASAGDAALLRTEGGEAIAIDPQRALRHGWDEGAPLEGACVVLGVRRAPAAGAYRGGLPVIRDGHPFAILRGDLTEAAKRAEALRERALGRALPLLWIVSLLPFGVVIAGS